jgi:hypothetical protein
MTSMVLNSTIAPPTDEEPVGLITHFDSEGHFITEQEFESGASSMELAGDSLLILFADAEYIQPFRIRRRSLVSGETIGIGGGATAVAYGLESIWGLYRASARLQRLDADTGAILTTIETPPQPVDLVYGSTVWVASDKGDLLTPFDIG